MLLVGFLAVIGFVAWAFAQSGSATAQATAAGTAGSQPAVHSCGDRCTHQSTDCPGHAEQGKCPCQDGKSCEQFKDADGDGKCDTRSQCGKHGDGKTDCHDKTACPHQKTSGAGCRHAKR
jgi:hypothetical protein